MTKDLNTLCRYTSVGMLVLICALNGCGSDKAPAPLAADQVDETQKIFATTVGSRLLTAWENEVFEPLGEDFVPSMRQGLPPDSQSAAHVAIKEKFGLFESMTFVEAYDLSEKGGSVMYRFRGSFSAAQEEPEVRVVIDTDSGQVKGFWVKPWRDGLG